jgi:hypothetical protein
MHQVRQAKKQGRVRETFHTQRRADVLVQRVHAKGRPAAVQEKTQIREKILPLWA